MHLVSLHKQEQMDDLGSFATSRAVRQMLEALAGAPHRSQTSSPLRRSARQAAYNTEHALMDLLLSSPPKHRMFQSPRGQKEKEKAESSGGRTKQKISQAFFAQDLKKI